MNKDQISDLILKNISFSYYEKNNKKIILDNFSCKIKKGKFTSIIGPSGTGKTSLLKIISGLIKPEKGQIMFNNQNFNHVVQKITLIQQNPSLMPWLNVYDNITLSNLTNKKMNDDNVNKLIKDIGLEQFSSYFPHQLSGGLLQRVAIARALLFDPNLLLLDEPFAALDILTIKMLQEIILNLQSTEEISVVICDHQARDLLNCVDRAIILSNGKIIASGSPNEVITDKDAKTQYFGDEFNIN